MFRLNANVLSLKIRLLSIDCGGDMVRATCWLKLEPGGALTCMIVLPRTTPDVALVTVTPTGELTPSQGERFSKLTGTVIWIPELVKDEPEMAPIVKFARGAPQFNCRALSKLKAA